MTQFSPQFPRNFSIPINIMLVGEAPGAEEEKEGKPFIGMSGKLLRKTLLEIEIEPDDVYITNTFWQRPPNNDVGFFFARNDGLNKVCLDYPSSGSNQFLKEDWRNVSPRLQSELDELQPRIILAAGRIPMWALTGQTQITRYAGNIMDVKNGLVEYNGKCIPIFHPAYMLRNRSLIDKWREDMRQIFNFIQMERQ